MIARYRYHLVQDPGLLRPVRLGVTLALSPDVLCYAVLIHGYLASQYHGLGNGNFEEHFRFR